jgi:hypothetical protein
LAAKAGLEEEGLRLIEDVLSEHENDADGWNTKGLIHGCGEPEESAKCYQRADLAPTSGYFAATTASPCTRSSDTPRRSR